jgi:iron complex transport system ATP-binding protein
MGEADKAAVDNALRMTDCMHLKDRIATTLSGGERARVLLARTIASGAPWLLADEPLASLDPFHQLRVMRILQDHARDGGAVLVAMHDLDLAIRYCDQLILLNDGELIGQDAPGVILSDENLSDVFGITAARWTSGDQEFLVPQESSPSSPQRKS